MTDRSGPTPVVYLTVDSLRRDVVDAYGSDRGLTPNISDLAADGAVFETAITNAPNTDQSFRAALTSLYPNEPVEMADRPYLPALLSEAGYETIAVYDTPKLAAKGFDRGFDVHPELGSDDGDDQSVDPSVVDRLKGVARSTVSTLSHNVDAVYELLKTVQFRSAPPYERAASISERTGTELADRSSDDVFLWAHYMDTHYPYLPTEGARDRCDLAVGDWRMANDNVAIQKFISSDFAADIDDALLGRLRDLYRCQVAYVDEAIGEVLDALRAEGLYEDALVIVASDHGEEFLEHGHLGHSQHLYDELIRVPFVVKPPSGTDVGARVDGLVEYLDITPTALDFAGAELPAELRGRSLREPMATGRSDTEFVISEWVHHDDRVASVRTRSHKYIRDDIRDRTELYDLASDPGEETNVADDDAEEAARLAGVLTDTLPEFSAHGPERTEVDPERTAQLEDLGYL